MIKIELFTGKPIICNGLSSDPMHPTFFLCQLADGDLIQVYYPNIKHISAYGDDAVSF